ncbi:hypothetical protein GYMLUDRAFT_43864 [Collybiopsis luxurians FD-317 M1]|uniref:Uncharacterized protein n=1 Tax=Collybiopsis luxurians FD-317 M1 TaxID=944289 RepID=A0A0D0BWU6_9AGAR|nr:hypothetical protein GYMLUDRAFT_43864 [Collybiopsis luxurians FD-317 M1]
MHSTRYCIISTKRLQFKPAGDADSTGVYVCVDSSSYRCFPYENPNLIPFERGIRR